MASVLRKVRVGLVVGAVLLVAVLGGFVFYGRLMMQRFKLDLPKRLGAHISQESHVVTYSQSSKGKTLFTVHAADQVQQDNGMILLHDVGIELYGRQDGQIDKIHGKDFTFDQKHGVMTGVGDVYIDLASPAGEADAAGRGKPGNTVHVKTSGLTFDQKAQTAVTEQGVEFATAGMNGTSVGAEYDAKTGVVELKSAVHIEAMQGNRPVEVTGSWAELEREQNVVLLTHAKYTVRGAVGSEAGSETVATEHAQVHITADGQPREIDGQGHVALTGENRGTMTGEQMILTLGETGKPKSGRLWGGVRYAFQNDLKKAWGAAREVQVGFDGVGNPAHVVANGGVTFEERTAGEGRALSAARVELGFGAAVKGKSDLRDADATGNAVLRMASTTVKGRRSTDVSGDELKARFATVAGKDAIQTLDGAGHTVVHQVGADGTDQTSKGATLAVSFRQGATEKHGDTAQIEHAAQGGGVTIVRTAPARASARILGVKATAAKSAVPSVEHASGEQAVYEADGDRLTLTGGARVEDAASVLLADAVTMQQGTGDATAEGNVRVSYLSSDAAGGASGAGSEPLHITAARAVEKKAAGTADFFGAAGKDARMWQGSSQVQAPVLNFFQTENDPASRRLIAHGEIAGDADFVRAVLVSEGSHAEGRGKREKGRESDGGPVRIVGHTMTYLAGPRTVEFDGKVKVEGQDGVLTAEKAIAYLAEAGAAAKPGGAAAAAGATLMAGRIERMVAHGGVEIEEPGRTGTGEQLVYTASDQTFVLTGTKAVPPKVVDDVQGTTTGAVLRFRSGDHSVVVSGDGAGPKVRSETRVKQ